MSAEPDRKAGKFIPTLTEVISSPKQMDLTLQKEEEREPGFDSSQSAPAPAMAKEERKEPLSSFWSPGGSPRKTGPGVVNVFPDAASAAMSPATPQPAAPSAQTRSEPMLDDEALMAVPQAQNVFSPLSRNPAAAPDSLRPSDLMLVALSERISAKAKARIEQSIEQHIQERIFPLLDTFAEHLISHIQDDLLKIMREGIAEATREELERLRQKN